MSQRSGLAKGWLKASPPHKPKQTVPQPYQQQAQAKADDPSGDTLNANREVDTLSGLAATLQVDGSSPPLSSKEPPPTQQPVGPSAYHSSAPQRHQAQGSGSAKGSLQDKQAPVRPAPASGGPQFLPALTPVVPQFMHQVDLGQYPEAEAFLESLKFKDEQNKRNLISIMTGARKFFQDIVCRDMTFINEVALSEFVAAPRPGQQLPASWETHRKEAELSKYPKPVWVYQIARDHTKLRPSRHLCPAGEEALWEAAERCVAVVAVVCACAWDPARVSTPLIINSTGLGGECKVLTLRAVKGEYRAPAGTVNNPLVVRCDANGAVVGVNSLLQPGVPYPDGRRAYKHSWLHARVRAPSGAVHDLWLDPTAAQFDRVRGPGIKSWHSCKPDAGERYVEDAAFSGNLGGVPLTRAQALESLNMQLRDAWEK